ncbi:MAG: YciI family protein [Pseudomonadota bacterium]
MPRVPARGSARQRQGQWQLALALRPRNGKPAVTDGPYPEAKELVGGFFIIEGADKDEAVPAASIHLAATLGESEGWGIEVHPIGFFEMTASK